MKTVPELKELLDKIRKNVDFLGNVVSVARPYYDFDVTTVEQEFAKIAKMSDEFVTSMNEVRGYTKKIGTEQLRVAIRKRNRGESDEGAAQIVKSAFEITEVMLKFTEQYEELMNRAIVYADVFKRHA